VGWEKKSKFEWNEKEFFIENIDPLGKWIEISENKKSHAMRDFYYIIFINYFASK